MRYSLRKQNKIKEKLGAKYLDNLVKSLNIHFKENSEIETFINPKLNLQTILVPSCTDSKIFEFVKIKQTYDVYNLSFYGEI
jgi:hypothetical protein